MKYFYQYTYVFSIWKLQVNFTVYSGQTLKKLRENDRKGENHVPDTVLCKRGEIVK